MNLFHQLRRRVASVLLSCGLIALSTSAIAVTPMISTGSLGHTVALKSDGTVVAWGGSNSNGELGNGTTKSSTVPVTVVGLTGVVAITTRSAHNVALKSDGTVMTWGLNQSGQLGNGSVTSSSVPIAVPGLTGVIAVSAGDEHVVALLSDGTVMAWGDNGYGQLGNGAKIVPPGFSISAPTTVGSKGSTVGSKGSKPMAVPGLTGVIAVSAGRFHTVALKSDGTVIAWGRNNYGQLGNATTTDNSTPSAVPSVTGLVAVAAGDFHVLGLKSDGTIIAWGMNNFGQLGDGRITTSLVPIVVPAVTGVVALFPGGQMSAVLKANGAVVMWGSNGSGELGLGTLTKGPTTPTLVPSISGVVSMAAAPLAMFALRSDGTVVYWGNLLRIGQPIYPPEAVPELNLGVSSVPERPVLPGITLERATSKRIAATIVPLPGEIGKSLPVYMAAIAGGSVYLRGTDLHDWRLFRGESMPVAQQIAAMPSSLSIDVLDLDISALTGMEIYAAYGDLTQAGHSARLLSVQKPTTIQYTNAASPVAMTSTSPLGWGLLIRRDASGLPAALDVVTPEGTYYQLSRGTKGLAQINFSGYQLSVSAVDANNEVTQVEVTSPDGTVVSLGQQGIPVARKLQRLRSDPVAAGCGLFSNEYSRAACNYYFEIQSSQPAVALLRGGLDILIDVTIVNAKRVDRVLSATENGWNAAAKDIARVRDSLTGVESEIARTGAELAAQGNTPNSAGILTYPEVPIQTGTSEESSRKIAADTLKVARQDYELTTMNSRTLTAPNGDWANPVACVSAYAPIKNVCVPVIRSVTPTAVIVNHSTSFVATGDDLTDGMKFFMSDCAPLDAISSGNFTRQQATCTPAKAGTFDGSWYMAKTGSPIFKGSIQVCPSTQVVTSGKCACKSTQEMVDGQCVDKCATGYIRQNGVCVVKPLTCSATQEIVNNTCVPKCGTAEVRQNGVCVKTTSGGSTSTELYIVGDWYWTEICPGRTEHGSAQFKSDGSYSQWSDAGRPGSGTWYVIRNTLVMSVSADSYSGTITGNSLAFTFKATNGNGCTASYTNCAGGSTSVWCPR